MPKQPFIKVINVTNIYISDKESKDTEKVNKMIERQKRIDAGTARLFAQWQKNKHKLI